MTGLLGELCYSWLKQWTVIQTSRSNVELPYGVQGLWFLSGVLSKEAAVVVSCHSEYFSSVHLCIGICIEVEFRNPGL